MGEQELRIERRTVGRAAGRAAQPRDALRYEIPCRVIRCHCSYHPRMNAPAPTPLYPPDGPQTIGQVLDAGFRIFKVSLVRCLLFGALAMIAGQLPNIYSLATGK